MTEIPLAEKAVKRAWRRRIARCAKECFRPGGKFSTRRNWRRTAVWKRARHGADLDSFLQNPGAWMTKGELLKDGNSATVVRATMDGREVVIKRNNIKNFRHWLSRWFRATRCRANWRNAHLLEICGIATPEPVAFLENHLGPLRFHGYYVCAFMDFSSAAEKYASQPPTERELGWFAELFTGMRQAQLSHGDFKASNLLVADGEIALIDLDSMRVCSSAKKFARLSAKDRRRFMRNWEGKPEQRSLFSGIFGEI